MAWIYLLIAGVLEVGWAVGLKYTDGFTKLAPSLLTGAAIVGSMVLLSYAARTIPIGTAYAVWVGIGAFGTAMIGMTVLGESASLARIACLALLVISVIGLKLAH